MNVDVRRSLHPLRIRYAAPVLSRVREFWTWWSGEIFAILPANLRDAKMVVVGRFVQSKSFAQMQSVFRKFGGELPPESRAFRF